MEENIPTFASIQWNQEPPAFCTSRDARWTKEDEARSYFQNRDFAPGPYIRGSVLGTGGYSIVYKVLRKEDGCVLAGKSSKTAIQLSNEARALRSMNHAHILKFVDFYQEAGNPAAALVVTELCTGDTLQTHIDNAPHGMPQNELLTVTLQISEALDYLHRGNRFHSDLKPYNILIRRLDPIDVVLADCADVKAVGTKKALRNTQLYRSPENVRFLRYNGKSDDIWALGITVLSMAGQLPRLEATKKGLQKYPRQCFEHVDKLKTMNPKHDIVHMMGRMVAWDAAKRASGKDCALLARQALDRTTAEDKSGNEKESNCLGIATPQDFQPRTFW